MEVSPIPRKVKICCSFNDSKKSLTASTNAAFFEVDCITFERTRVGCFKYSLPVLIPK